MKRIATLLFIAALLLTLNACFFTEVAPGTYHGGPSFILNGIKQNTFTIHYGITEEYVYIPTNHFLAVIGATENHPSSYAGSTFFNVTFTYKRKDLCPLEDTNAKLLVMYAEQIIRSMIETGMIAPKMKEKEDGESVEK